MEAAIATQAACPAAARVDTRDTSNAALAAVGLRKMAKQQQEIYDVILGAQRNGASDLSLTEIRDLYERVHGKRIDLNRVSARVSDLVAAKRIERKQDTRPCSVTSRPIHPVHVPPTQPRLFA
jgi:hypothetical protein